MNNKVALIWSGLERFAYQIINFIIIIWLARLLSPADFGAISIVMAVIYILNIFMEAGFGSLIIQKNKISPEEINTIFFTNLGLAIIFYIFVFFTSSFIEDFLAISHLEVYLKVASIILIVNALGIVQFALIERNLNFRKLFLINIVALILAGSSAVIFAILNYGVWSLIIFQIVISVVKVILYYFNSEWRPRLKCNFPFILESWGYTKNILFSSLIEGIYQKGIYFLIGKFSSPSTLGYFEQASKAKDVPTVALSASVRRVFFPMFSRIQDDKIQILRKFKKGLGILFFLATPLMFIMYFFSEFIVIILFSEKWAPAAIYLKLLSLMVIPYILFYINIDLFKAQGNSKLYMRINVGSKIFGILLMVFAAFFGLDYVLYAFVLTQWLAYLLAAYMVQKKSILFLDEQFLSAAPFLLYSFSGIIVIKVFFEFLVIENFYVLNFLSLILFSAVYLTMAFFFSKKLRFSIFQ